MRNSDMNEFNRLHEDALTMALRLMGESDDSFSPETREVMTRWRKKCQQVLSDPDAIRLKCRVHHA